MMDTDTTLDTYAEVTEAIAVLMSAARNYGAHEALKTTGQSASMLGMLEAREELMQAIHRHRVAVLDWAGNSRSS